MSELDKRMTAIKAGVAAITTCVVETMEEMQPGSRDAFMAKIAEAYRMLRDSESSKHLEAVELVIWTGEVASGWKAMRRSESPFVG